MHCQNVLWVIPEVSLLSICVSFFSLEKNLNDGISMTFVLLKICVVNWRSCACTPTSSKFMLFAQIKHSVWKEDLFATWSRGLGIVPALAPNLGTQGPKFWGSADNPEHLRVPGNTSESLFTSSRAQVVFLYLLMMEGMAVLFTASLVMCCWLWSVCAQQGFAYSYIL